MKEAIGIHIVQLGQVERVYMKLTFNGSKYFFFFIMHIKINHLCTIFHRKKKRFFQARKIEKNSIQLFFLKIINFYLFIFYILCIHQLIVCSVYYLHVQ